MHRVGGSNGRASPRFQGNATQRGDAMIRTDRISVAGMTATRAMVRPVARRVIRSPCPAAGEPRKNRLPGDYPSRQARRSSKPAVPITRQPVGGTCLRCGKLAVIGLFPAFERKPRRATHLLRAPISTAMHIRVRVPSMNESSLVCSTSARASQASTAGDAAVAREGLQVLAGLDPPLASRA